MTWLKVAAAAFGVLITLLSATSDARATVIGPGERIAFDEGRILLDNTREVPVFSSQPFVNSRSLIFFPDVAADKIVDGEVQLDVTNIEYGFRRRDGQSASEAKAEAAQSWTFTLLHADRRAEFSDFPTTGTDFRLTSAAFDGVTTRNGWVLTGRSDYHDQSSRTIEFDFAGSFFAGPGGAVHGSVPAPAPLLLILAGLAGIAARRRD